MLSDTTLAQHRRRNEARVKHAVDGFDGMTDVNLALVNMRDADCC